MVTGWKVSSSSDVFFQDLAFEFLEGLLLMALVWFMRSGIAMKPLSVGDGVKFL